MRFLFVDKIVHFIPRETCRGIKTITPNEYYLSRSNDGSLSFGPSLIGEALGQLAAWNVMSSNNFAKRPVAGIAGRASFYRPVYVDETILLESFIDQLNDDLVSYHAEASVAGEVVFRLEDALGPLLPMEEFISKEQARLQFEALMSLSINSQTSEVAWDDVEESNKPWDSILTFDSVCDLKPDVSIVAQKKVNVSAPFFPDHFPKKPVLPMTVLLECKLALARLFIERSQELSLFQIQEVRRIKMNDFVRPGDVITCHLKVKERSTDALVLACRTDVNARRVCMLEMLLSTHGN